MVVRLVGGNEEICGAELVLGAIVQRRLERGPEGRCLLLEEVEALQGEIDRPVEDQAGDTIRMGADISLG